MATALGEGLQRGRRDSPAPSSATPRFAVEDRVRAVQLCGEGQRPHGLLVAPALDEQVAHVVERPVVVGIDPQRLFIHGERGRAVLRSRRAPVPARALAAADAGSRFTASVACSFASCGRPISMSTRARFTLPFTWSGAYATHSRRCVSAAPCSRHPSRRRFPQIVVLPGGPGLRRSVSGTGGTCALGLLFASARTSCLRRCRLVCASRRRDFGCETRILRLRRHRRWPSGPARRPRRRRFPPFRVALFLSPSHASDASETTLPRVPLPSSEAPFPNDRIPQFLLSILSSLFLGPGRRPAGSRSSCRREGRCTFACH